MRRMIEMPFELITNVQLNKKPLDITSQLQSNNFVVVMSSRYVQLAQKILARYGADSNFNGITKVCRLVEAEKDRVTVEFEVDKSMTNSWNTLHGGCTASLVDMITTTAILTNDRNEQQHPGVSVDLKVSYCTAAKLGETVVLDAIIEKFGRSLVFTRADLRTKDNSRLIATAQHIKAFTKPPTKSTE
ncbi:hypothetical protein M3Y95_00596500 [Aphelenchoides besseyi]|nr:hypothetical protein M3Y95_00596500 [Aphelenchoides besseyi]